MDELLRRPQSSPIAERAERAKQALEQAGRVLSGLRQSADAVWSDAVAPITHKLQAYARRHPISPLMFLALAVAAGFAAVVLNTYEPSYVVTVDGVDIGIVRDTAVFENAMDSVEARASRILGEDYTIDSEVVYTRALSEADAFTSSGVMETYLFNRIGEIVMGYDLAIDGVVYGSADQKETLEELLYAVASTYITENTVDYGFEADISITANYITSESNLDLDDVFTTLTTNTTGETTYTVVSGDTYSEIAQDNEMSLDELMALNPQASLSSLFVGDVLNVKKIIPFLSVRTVDNITYNAVIESPIEYVDDANMYEGNTKVITQGTDGEAIVNADVTYVNGYETERTIVSSQTITEPTTTVIARGTAPRPRTASNGYYIWPCSGYVSSGYGGRSIFGSYSFHHGLDIAGGYGTSIVAADGGLVTFAGWNNGGYGYLVVITHDNGAQTYYAHNSSLCVSVGERVYQGQLIARMGSTGRSTGNHCHFEIRINGSTVNPRNYLP